MPGYYQNLITVTVKDFEAVGNANRGGVWAYVGWDSTLLTLVRSTLAAYWREPSAHAKRELQRVVQRWHAEKRSEFDKRDELSKGICTRLLEEVTTPDRAATGTQSIILNGELRAQASKRTQPFVQCEDLSVISLMTHALASKRGVGVIVIDLYSDDLRAQGLDRRYDGGGTVLENMVDVLRFASNQTIRHAQVPVINFVMGRETTIGTIARELPPWTVHLTKPTHNAFDKTTLAHEMDQSGCKYWVIFGFNANQCVAATIFGSPSTSVVKKTTIWDDEIGNTQMRYDMDWCPGALDRGYHVITSRLILASNGGSELQPREGWPDLGPNNW